mgnify:CR=1 FL=1
MSTTRIERWVIFEARLTRSTDGNPYLDVTSSAQCTNDTQADDQANRDQPVVLIAQWVKG